MTTTTLRAALLWSACIMCLAVTPSSQAEIALAGGQQPGPPQQRIPAEPVHADMALRVQCWQEGVKIIDQDGLQGLSLNSVTQQRSVSFKRQRQPQPSVFILPFDDSLCLIQPAR